MSVKKVSWSQRLYPDDRDYLDRVLEEYQKEKGLESKGEALVHFVKNRVEVGESDSAILKPTEIRYPDDIEFESTCPFGFLRKISGKDGLEKWHCLKNQGPTKKGKPMLLADGYDKQSIRALCEVCQINWQADPAKIDQVKMVFEQLGDETLSSKLYFCTRDAIGGGIKLSPTINGRFYCIERSHKVTIKNTCLATGCPFLVQREITLALRETVPFLEVQKRLEAI